MEVHYNPADYEDSTGEIAHVLTAAALGGIFGGGGAALSSIVSQKMNGEKIDWKKVGASAANGAFTGATQAALIASGAGVPAALLANFLAGTAGSAAEQAISEGKVDVRKSVTHGVTNAVSNALYGTDDLKNVWDAVGRGVKTGAAEAAINYISDYIGSKTPQVSMEPGTSAAILPYVMQRDPKKNCGGKSPFEQSTGYSSARGYWYNISTPEESQKKYSLGGFLKETALGGIMGGLTSAAFYGADKGIKKLWASVKPKPSVMPKPKPSVMPKPEERVMPRPEERVMPKIGSNNPTGGNRVWDYSNRFDNELHNFNNGYEIKNIADKDMYLVQLHSDKKVGDGRSLMFWTTYDEMNGISTIEDYKDKMALLNEWGARDHVTIAKISAGTKIKYAIGTAKAQMKGNEFRPGGGLQLAFDFFNDGWVTDTRLLR